MCLANKAGLILAIAICGSILLGCKMLGRSSDGPSSALHSPTPAASAPDPVKTKVQLEAAFGAKQDEFTTVPVKAQLTNAPYILDKAAFYLKDVKFGEKDAGWSPLNASDGAASAPIKVHLLEADTPDKVGTVVLIACSQYKIHDYEVYNGTVVERTIPAYNRSCELTVIDRTIASVIYRKKFSSELDKHQLISGDTSAITAPIPYSDIYGFLEGLSQRAPRVDKLLSAGDLIRACNDSEAKTQAENDGKELTLRGFSMIAAQMPKSATERGLFSIGEKDDPVGDVFCWFDQADAAAFARVKGNQFVTVKGIFDGRASCPALNHCKVVKIE
jgi:hypothetical protein